MKNKTKNSSKSTKNYMKGKKKKTNKSMKETIHDVKVEIEVIKKTQTEKSGNGKLWENKQKIQTRVSPTQKQEVKEKISGFEDTIKENNLSKIVKSKKLLG